MLGLIVQRHNALPGLSGPTLAGKGEVAPKAVLQWKQTILGLLVKGNPVPHLFFLGLREINFSGGLVYGRLCVPTIRKEYPIS